MKNNNKFFQRNNSEIIVSKYRSIYGYTLFYIYDFEHNLISDIMQSASAPIKTTDARIITTVKNFKRVKELHDSNLRRYNSTLINEIDLLDIKRYKQEVKQWKTINNAYNSINF